MPWAPDYITGTELATYARVDDVVDAVLYASCATAASRAVDGYCNRQFGLTATAVARTYRQPPAYDPSTARWIVAVDDVQTLTGLLVGGVSLALSGAALGPDNAAADGRPYEYLAYTDRPTAAVVVTAQWGWSAVPEQVKQACKVQGLRFAVRRDSPYGTAGSPETGSELRVLSRLDPDVRPMLLSLTRRRRMG